MSIGDLAAVGAGRFAATLLVALVAAWLATRQWRGGR